MSRVFNTSEMSTVESHDEILLSYGMETRSNELDGFTLMKPKKRDERESSDNKGEM